LVLLTFDDGTRDHYEALLPLLEKYGAVANFCIAETEPGPGHPGFEDKSHFMTWEQIKALSDKGHEIVNHSWHHSMEFARGTEEFILEEIRGIDQRCAEYDIPKPITFAYPGGGCTPKTEAVLHACGYFWGRGDMSGTAVEREGENYYDPYLDSPLAMPSFNMVPAYPNPKIAAIVNGAADGRIAIFAYHQIHDKNFLDTTFENQLACMADCGAKFVTFRDLKQYIDPQKAYVYTHSGAIFSPKERV
jgi:peptidoglycan/xylan/chitin deacetylase (PgdA/CDA1 family)